MSKSPARGKLPAGTGKPNSPPLKDRGRAVSPSTTLRVHVPTSPPCSPTSGHRHVGSPGSGGGGGSSRNSPTKGRNSSPSASPVPEGMTEVPKIESFREAVTFGARFKSPTKVGFKSVNQKPAKPQLTEKNLAKFSIEKEDAPLHTAVKDLDYPCNDKSLGVNSFHEWSYFKQRRNYSKGEVAAIDAKLEEEFQAEHGIHHTLRSNTANEKVRHHKHPIELDRLLVNKKSSMLWNDDLLNKIENHQKYKQEPEYKVLPKVKETKIHKLRMKNAKAALQRWFNVAPPASKASSVAGSNASSVKTGSRAQNSKIRSTPGHSDFGSPTRSSTFAALDADDSTIATDISGTVLFGHTNMATSSLAGDMSGLNSPTGRTGGQTPTEVAGYTTKPMTRQTSNSNVDVLSPMMSRMPSGHIQGLSRLPSETDLLDSGAATPQDGAASRSKQPSRKGKRGKVKVADPVVEEIKAVLTVKRTSRDTSTALKGGTGETTINDVLEHIQSNPPSRSTSRVPTRSPTRAPTRAPSRVPSAHGKRDKSS